MLTDILIADKSEAQAIAETVYPLGQWNGLDAKGQSPITLATLLCLLSSKSHRNEIVDEFTLLSEAANGNLFVCQVPERLVLALSRLRTGEVPILAHQWSQTDEMLAAGFACAQALVEELSRLSNEAVRQQKNLLLWMSL